MSKALEDIRFHSPGIFAGQTGVIDPGNHIIRGVSVITGGIEAEGHDLLVDDTTLKQLQTCAKEKGKIPVSLDHGSGVKDLNGYLTAFRMDGNKLRADWHLMASHGETDKMLERAEMMPECFGLSVAFKGPPKGEPVGNGKMAARCEKLLSVDCVTRPAANVGLFSEGSVDTLGNGMAKANTAAAGAGTGDPAQGEPTNAQIMEALSQITERLDSHEQFINQNQPEPTLEDLHNMSDEELQALNERLGTDITRDEVNAAVQEAVAAMESEAEAEAAGDRNTGERSAEGELVGAGASAETGADTSAPATFQAVVNAVIQLQARLDAREKAERKAVEDKEFADIDSKITQLEAQRNDAVTKLTTKNAECDALRLAVKTGTRPVVAGIDNDVRVLSVNEDGKLHDFQARLKQLEAGGKTAAEAIIFAQKENPALHGDWVQSLKRK